MNIKRGGSREPKKPPLDPPLKILSFVLFITLVPITVLTPITWQFLMALKNELQYLKA